MKTTQQTSSSKEVKTTEQNNFLLTPEEKKLIELQRERKELEAKEKAAKQEIENAKNIQRKRNEIEEFKKTWTMQNLKASLYYEELVKIGGKYFLKSEDKTQTFDVFVYTDEKDEKGYNVKKEIFREEISYKRLTITRENFVIEVKEHIVYSGRFSTYRTNKGWEMFMRHDHKDKWYKQATTINKYLNEQIESAKREIEWKKEKQDKKKIALAFAKAEFENNFDKIELDEAGYYIGQGSRREWRTIDVINLSKGGDIKIQLTFFVDSDDSVTFNIRSMTIPSDKTLTLLRTF